MTRSVKNEKEKKAGKAHRRRQPANEAERAEHHPAKEVNRSTIEVESRRYISGAAQLENVFDSMQNHGGQIAKCGLRGVEDVEDNGGCDADEMAEDEFEQEMEREFQRRADDAEKFGRLANEGNPPDGGGGGGIGEKEKPKGDGDKYDDIYFDTDEEDDDDDAEGPRSNRRKKQTDDDLFYDPNQDDEDQEWIDDVRRAYVPKDKRMAAKANAKSGVRALPNSDAVLNCPACFMVVCLDCQRHETYKTQYRAMFVINCSVDETQKLKFPVKNKQTKKKKKGVDSSAEASEAAPSFAAPEDDEDYNPVKCEQCSTEVAVYDKDEIYHFFNVIASHT